MTKSPLKQSLGISVSLLLILAFAAATTTAQEKIKVAGTLTMAITQQEMMVVNEADNHVISLYAYDGFNKGASNQAFMHGAQIVNMGTSDLIKGMGSHQGYVRFTKGGESILAKWSGKVNTTLSAEGAPLITFEGTYAYMDGTGQYAHVQGGGTYSGKYLSKTIVTSDWEGEYSIKK